MAIESNHSEERNVLITTSSFGTFDCAPLDKLAQNGFSVELNPFKRKLTEQEAEQILSEKNIVGLIAGLEPLTDRVFEKAKELKVISRVGVGLDSVDLEAAKKRGIQVYNTPNILTDSVAELTINLILSCLRHTSRFDRKLHQGIWKKEMGCLFKGKTLGLIGFGNIGKRVAQIAFVFGARVIVYDIQDISNCGNCEQVEFSELVQQSDIISLHISGKQTVIGKQEMAEMKDGAILINTSRGCSVDEESLYEALVSQKIAAAALDVFEQEPYYGKFCELENVVLTPHIGSYSKEARLKMEHQAVENLLKGMKEVFKD